MSYELMAKSLESKEGKIAFKVILSNEGVIEKQGIMNPENLASFITKHQVVKEEARKCRIGEIPEGFYDGFVSSDGLSRGALIKVPMHKHQFVVKEDEVRKSFYIPMPNLLYLLVCKGGKPTTFKVFCFKEWNGTKTRLFYYPFGNVSTNGGICMGSISYTGFNNFASFTDFREYIEASLMGVTNGDYLDHKNGKDMCRLSEEISQMDFCERLQKSNAEVFPSELLLEDSVHNIPELLKYFD